MQCAKCGLYKELVADIRACSGCQDGTAAQIPADTLDSMLILDAIPSIPGLGNRFNTNTGPGLSPPDLAVQEARARETKWLFDAAEKAKAEAKAKADADAKLKADADAKAKDDAKAGQRLAEGQAKSGATAQVEDAQAALDEATRFSDKADADALAARKKANQSGSKEDKAAADAADKDAADATRAVKAANQKLKDAQAKPQPDRVQQRKDEKASEDYGRTQA